MWVCSFVDHTRESAEAYPLVGILLVIKMLFY